MCKRSADGGPSRWRGALAEFEASAGSNSWTVERNGGDYSRQFVYMTAALWHCNEAQQAEAGSHRLRFSRSKRGRDGKDARNENRC